MPDWFADDPFWTTFAPILFPPDRVAAAPAEVDGFVRLAGIAPGAAVLDLCCGPGRHSLELARRGYRVTAVDRTIAYLEALQEQAREAKLVVESVQDDMRTFRRPEAFDAVLNTFTSFGYFEDPEDDARVLRAVHASLRPGGRLVLDVVGKEVLARGWQERYWTWLDEHRLLLEERVVERAFTWVRNTWTIVEGAERRSWTLAHRLYAASELAALLGSCGFDQVTVFGGLDGAPYDRHAWRLVAVGTRAS